MKNIRLAHVFLDNIPKFIHLNDYDKMKKIVLFIALFCVATPFFGQAFYGKGDVIFQVGANLQNHGTGIRGSLDFGLGDNISLGIASSYLLGVDKARDAFGKEVPVASFKDRFDLKGRFNANLGNVINVDDKFDFYPGLHVSLKNFGGHVGARYFFTYGFGVFAEFEFPISKYNTDHLTPAEKLHNQASFNIGAAFGL